jgi:hypothetical protein
VNASRILRDSALIGFPLNIPVALLYGFWSSRRTIVIMASMTAAAILGFVVTGRRVAEDGALAARAVDRADLGDQLAYCRHGRLCVGDLPDAGYVRAAQGWQRHAPRPGRAHRGCGRRRCGGSRSR